MWVGKKEGPEPVESSQVSPEGFHRDYLHFIITRQKLIPRHENGTAVEILDQKEDQEDHADV